MLERLFQEFAPQGWQDALVKGMGVILLLVSCNLIFFGIAARSFDVPATYVALHAVIVGGPWVVLFFFITTFQMKLQRKLTRLSCKDDLTGLDNRRTFLDAAREAQSQSGVLMMLDADRFKAINDTHGHCAGDACLRSIAVALAENVRETDIVGRLGGEEFAVLLVGASLDQAEGIANRLTLPIEFVHPINKTELSVTLSVGAVTAWPDETLEVLLAKADEALYEAKKTGRARTVFWEGSVAAS